MLPAARVPLLLFSGKCIIGVETLFMFGLKPAAGQYALKLRLILKMNGNAQCIHYSQKVRDIQLSGAISEST